MTMSEIDDIHWHDCELESVIEIPGKDMLVLNVQYPEYWDQNIFTPRGIIFEGYHSQVVHEIPFEGNPTILGARIETESDGFKTIRLETNAGFRLVTAQKVGIGEQVHI